MAVNLEELALKSIEQYAALNVKMHSLEIAISEMNRKAEINQDRFSLACDKLSRMEEKISTWMEDRKLIHERIDDTRTELDKLIEVVRELTRTVKDHKEDHCDDCINNDRLDVIEKAVALVATKDQLAYIENRLEEVAKVDSDLLKVREMVTTPQGILAIKFFTSKPFLITIGILLADLCLDFYGHYDIIKTLWTWGHFGG